MSLNSSSVLRQCTASHSMSSVRRVLQRRRCATTAEQSTTDGGDTLAKPSSLFRTNETNPAKFTRAHIAQWYDCGPAMVHNMSLLDRRQLRGPVGVRQTAKDFETLYLMARMPIVKIMSPSIPAPRLCVYGEFGMGKSTVLLQMAHYAQTNDAFLVHVPNVMRWTRDPQDVSMSTYKAMRVDQPIVAVEALHHFKKYNEHMEEAMKTLLTTKDYLFTERESLPVGTTLMELVDYGIQRTKFATDVFGAVLRELRASSSAGKCRTIVAVDQVQSLFATSHIRRADDRSMIPCASISLVHHVTKMLTADWSNGLCVTVVDQSEHSSGKASSTGEPQDLPEATPHAILNEEAHDVMHPFIPVECVAYSKQELDSAVDFMDSLHWIANKELMTRRGREQLFALTAGSPFLVHKYIKFS